MNFRTWLENSSSHLLIVEARGSTSGHHGFGDTPERPAADPKTVAEWEIHLKNPQIEKMLTGLPAIIVDQSGGSYHERWCRIDIYVTIPQDIEEKIFEIDPNFQFPQGTTSRYKKEYPAVFNGVNDIIQKAKSILNFPEPKAGESGANYMARRINVAKMGKPMGRDWDGD